MPREVTFVVYMENQGDGSACPRFFPDAASAEAYAEANDERFCDDIETHTILVDDEGGIAQPPRTKLRDDGVLIDDYKIDKYTYTSPTDYSVRWRGGDKTEEDE